MTSAPAEPRPRRAPTVLRGVTVVHAASIAIQPIFAGLYLAGNFPALNDHQINASIIVLTGMILWITAVASWLVRHVRGWVPLVAAGLWAAEVVQMIAGYARLLAVHIPLGVGVVGAAIVLAYAVFRPAARKAAR